jgi:soluble cytochrome b562
MKLHTLFVIGLTIGLTACAKEEQVAAPAEEVEASAAAEAPAAETPAAEASTIESDQMGTAAFIEHMHHHASQLSQLKAAVDVGSLPAAQRPAYWLSGHEEISGIPEGWLVYVNGMRDGAKAVDSAESIEQAKAAVQQIEASCNGCHVSAGIEVEI